MRRITRPGELDEARRDLLTEIVVYLALHQAGVHPNVLAGAVWPRGVSEEVRDSALAGGHLVGSRRAGLAPAADRRRGALGAGALGCSVGLGRAAGAGQPVVDRRRWPRKPATWSGPGTH